MPPTREPVKDVKKDVKEDVTEDACPPSPTFLSRSRAGRNSEPNITIGFYTPNRRIKKQQVSHGAVKDACPPSPSFNRYRPRHSEPDLGIHGFRQRSRHVHVSFNVFITLDAA